MIKSSSIWQPVTAIQTRTFVELTPHNLFCYFGSTGKHDLLACRWLQDKTDKHLDNLNRFSQRQCLEWIFISEPSSLYIQGRELALCFWGVFNTRRKYNSAFTASYILFVFVLWGSFFNFENPRVENGQHYTLKRQIFTVNLDNLYIFFSTYIFMSCISCTLGSLVSMDFRVMFLVFIIFQWRFQIPLSSYFCFVHALIRNFKYMSLPCECFWSEAKDLSAGHWAGPVV